MAELSADDKARVEILSDLRVLLNFLDANPDVPVDRYAARIEHCVSDETNEAGVAIVEKAAAALGVTVEISDGGHISAALNFGEAQYRIFFVPRESMAEHHAGEAAKPRGECIDCGRSIQLKLDGTVGHHAGAKGTGSPGWRRAYRCFGAGQLPKELVRLDGNGAATPKQRKVRRDAR